MAKQEKKHERGTRLFANHIVDYSDGDIAIYDNVTDISSLYPVKPMANLLALCTKGKMSVTISGRELNLESGYILFCPPSAKIDDARPGADFECKLLCLSDHVIQGLLRDKISVWNHAVYVHQTNVIHMSEECKEDFTFYYALLRSKISRADKGSSREVVQTIIRALLIELCDVFVSMEEHDSQERVLQSRQLFNRFLKLLSDSEVKRRPANYYAAQLNITPKYLTMLCQQYSDKTASEWIIQYTVDDIRYYLAHQELSVKEIALRLGFSNISHFGSYVRKHLGLSPNKYREKNANAGGK